MRNQLSIMILLGCLCTFGGPVQAQSSTDRFSGTYENKGSYWQKVVIARKSKTDQYVGAFDVATRGCQGDVKMIGFRKSQNSLVFSKRDPSMSPETCTIAVTFSSGFDAIKVSHAYCRYSGAACDFNGNLKRVSR